MINSDLPKISIVTPSFNQGAFLEETIDSVLSQNYPNLEYIIIDGGSSDNSIEIIKRYERHLTYWISEKDRGQSHAINKGLKKVTGDIFNWLNSDDFYEPKALFKVGEVFKDKRVKMAAFRSNIFGKESRVSKGTDIFENLEKTIAYSRIDQPETFFSFDAIKEIGGVKENMHYCMDQDLYLRFLFKYGLEPIVKREEVIVNFRIHEDSKTNNHRQKFTNEKDNMFLALSKKSDEKKIEKFIEGFIGQENNLGFTYDDLVMNKSHLNGAIHYFLFFKGMSLYGQSRYKDAQKYFELINTKFLLKEDQDSLRKVIWRNKNIPKPILEVLRNLKSKTSNA